MICPSLSTDQCFHQVRFLKGRHPSSTADNSRDMVMSDSRGASVSNISKSRCDGRCSCMLFGLNRNPQHKIPPCRGECWYSVNISRGCIPTCCLKFKFASNCILLEYYWWYLMSQERYTYGSGLLEGELILNTTILFGILIFNSATYFITS